MNYIFPSSIGSSLSAKLELIILTSSARLVLAIARTSARLAIAYALASAKPRTAPPVQDCRPGRPPLDTPHFRPHASSSLSLGHRHASPSLTLWLRQNHAPLRPSRTVALDDLRSTRRISDRTPRPRYRSDIGSKSPCPFKVFLACVPPYRAAGGVPPVPPRRSRP